MYCIPWISLGYRPSARTLDDSGRLLISMYHCLAAKPSGVGWNCEKCEAKVEDDVNGLKIQGGPRISGLVPAIGLPHLPHSEASCELGSNHCFALAIVLRIDFCMQEHHAMICTRLFSAYVFFLADPRACSSIN